MALSNLLSNKSQLYQLVTVSDIVPSLDTFMVNTTIPLEDMATVLETWLTLGPDRPIYRNVYGACKRTEQPWNPELVGYTQADIDALIHCTNFLLLPTWLNEKYLYPEILQRYLSHPEWTDWETWLSGDEFPIFEAAVEPFLKSMTSEIPMTLLSHTETSNIMNMNITMDNVYNVTHELKHFHNVLAALMGLKNDQTGSPHASLQLTLRGGHIPTVVQSCWNNRALVELTCMSGSLQAIRHLETLGIPVVEPQGANTSTKELMNAVIGGNLELIQYIVQRMPIAEMSTNIAHVRRLMLEHACTPAIQQSRRDILDYLFAAGIPITTVHTKSAAYHNNLAMFEYLLARGAPLHEEVLREAIRRNNIELTTVAIRHKCPLHICFPYLCWELKRKEILHLLMTQTDMPALIQSQQPRWTEEVYAFIHAATSTTI